MKIFSILLLQLTLILNNCSEKTDVINSKIEYEIFTRGTYKKLTIENQKLFFSKNREEKGDEVEVSKEDWKLLFDFFETINLENLNQLKAPSNNRAGDRSFHANFKVEKNGKTYQSNQFDHGNPPLEIKKFIDKLSVFLK